MVTLAASTGLYSLPNELLLQILTSFQTTELLPLTTTSHRIYTLILRILHNRLSIAASLHDHTLLLECYQPSTKLTEPPFYCTYLGTRGLESTNLFSSYLDTAASSLSSSNEDTLKVDTASELGRLKNLYSRFRPHRRNPDAPPPRLRPHPAGDIPGSRTHPSTSDRSWTFEDDVVVQHLSLDSHELFTQLCSITNLIKMGPRNGLFRCFVEVEVGVMRVWRDWLAHMAARERGEEENPGSERQGRGKVEGKGKEGAEHRHQYEEDPDILWVTPARHVGLRFCVTERKTQRRQAPVLMLAEEEEAVSYNIEYEEILVRTSHLLLTLEQSIVQQDTSQGKTVVFGSFG